MSVEDEVRRVGEVLHGLERAQGVVHVNMDARRYHRFEAPVEIAEVHSQHRSDVVFLVNSMQLGVLALKNPDDENATIWSVWRQFHTYKADIFSLVACNAALMFPDVVDARLLDSSWNADVEKSMS